MPFFSAAGLSWGERAFSDSGVSITDPEGTLLVVGRSLSNWNLASFRDVHFLGSHSFASKAKSLIATPSDRRRRIKSLGIRRTNQKLFITHFPNGIVTNRD